jgi:hypothetical protein
MCDYSLEMYQSRPARAGERYETHRFHSGSIGFASPGASDVAVCMACDTKLTIERLPLSLQQALGIPETAKATFVRLDLGPHHDGLRFDNGVEISLQRLGPGVAAYMTEDIAIAPPLKTRALAEVR